MATKTFNVVIRREQAEIATACVRAESMEEASEIVMGAGLDSFHGWRKETNERPCWGFFVTEREEQPT